MTPAEARPILQQLATRAGLTPWEREAVKVAANLLRAGDLPPVR